MPFAITYSFQAINHSYFLVLLLHTLHFIVTIFLLMWFLLLVVPSL